MKQILGMDDTQDKIVQVRNVRGTEHTEIATQDGRGVISWHSTAVTGFTEKLWARVVKFDKLSEKQKDRVYENALKLSRAFRRSVESLSGMQQR